MGAEKILFKSEEKKTAAEAAAVLRTIAERLEQGHIQLKQAGNECSLSIPSNLVLEIKVEEKLKRRVRKSLEIELEWLEGEEQEGVMIA